MSTIIEKIIFLKKMIYRVPFGSWNFSLILFLDTCGSSRDSSITDSGQFGHSRSCGRMSATRSRLVQVWYDIQHRHFKSCYRSHFYNHKHTVEALANWRHYWGEGSGEINYGGGRGAKRRICQNSNPVLIQKQHLHSNVLFHYLLLLCELAL